VRQRREPTGWFAELLAEQSEDPPVDLVEPELVDTEERETFDRDGVVDDVVALDRGEVADATSNRFAIRGVPRLRRAIVSAASSSTSLPTVPRAAHDDRELVNVVEVELAHETKTVAQWRRHQTGPRVAPTRVKFGDRDGWRGPTVLVQSSRRVGDPPSPDRESPPRRATVGESHQRRARRRLEDRSTEPRDHQGVKELDPT